MFVTMRPLGFALALLLVPVAAGAQQTSITVTAAAGSEALSIQGHAAPRAPVTLTLLASIDPDVPLVVVSRHFVTADANGNFSAYVPTAPAFFRNATLTVIADSNGSTASGQVVVGPPNAGPQ